MKLSQVCSHFRGGLKSSVIVIVVIMILMLTSRQGAGYTIAAGVTKTYPESFEISRYTGDPWIVDGTLNITSPTYEFYFRTDLAISGTGTVNNAGLLFLENTIGSGNASTNSGTLTNTGTVKIESGSSLTNSSSITNSGSITITGGSLIQGAAATYSGAGSIVFNGTAGTFTNNQAAAMNITSLTVNSGKTGTINGSGTTAIGLTTANESGTLNYTGSGGLSFTNLSLSGGVFNNGTGALNIGTATVSNGNTGTIGGTGAIGLTTADVDGTLTVSAILSGAGSLTKTGTGKLILTGANTYTGATTIDGGTMSVNGSITSDVTVDASGILAGSGNIYGAVTNAGTLAPGNSIGTLTIAGNYIQNVGSTYQVEVNSSGQSDKLVATGTATINGGTVSVLAESGTYNMKTIYTILNAAGGVTGAYDSATSNLAFLTPSLSYDINDVYLTLTRNATGFADVAATPNQDAVASGLDRASPYAQGDMSEIMNNLLGLSAQGARNAYNQMGGLSHVSLEETTFFSFNRYVNTLSGRMAGFNTGGMPLADAGNILLVFNENTGSDAGNMLVSAIRNAKKEDASSWGLWAKGYGNMGERLGDDIATKYDYNGGGLIVGFDGKVDEKLLLGVAAGYSYTKVDMNDLNEDGKVASYQGSLYGAYNIDQWYVNGLIAYGYNRYDTTRNIIFGNIARTAQADYSGHSLSGYVETGYQINTEAVNIIPLASIQAGSLWREAFTERNAGALDLSADSDRMSSFIGSLGVKLRKEYRIQNGSITPEVRVRWLNEFAGSDYTLNASFADDPVSTFSVRGDRAQRDSAAVGAGVNWEIGKSLGFALTYDATFSGDRTEHGGTAGIRYRW